MNALDFYPTRQGNYQYTPLVMETKYNFIINNTMFRKQDLKGVELDGFYSERLPIFSYNYLYYSMHLNKTLAVYRGDLMYRNREGTHHVVADPYINNRYYINMGHVYMRSSSHILAVDETADDVKMAWFCPCCHGDYYIYEICCITENRIFCLCEDCDGNNVGLYSIDKKQLPNNYQYNMVHHFWLTPVHYNRPHMFYEDNRYMYFFTHGGANQTSIWLVDKVNFLSANRCVSIDAGFLNTLYSGSNMQVSGYVFLENDNVYRIGSKFYFFMPGYNYTENKFIITSFMYDVGKSFDENNFDRNTAVVLATDDFVEWSPVNSNMINRYHIKHRFWNINGYLYMAFYSDYIDSNVSGADRINIANSQCIMSFKIHDDAKLTYVGRSDLSDFGSINHIAGLTFSSDKKTLIIGGYGAFHIAKLNESTHIYEITTDCYTSSVSEVCFDELDRLWIHYEDNSVEVFSITDPKNVTLEFESYTYVWHGSNLSSYILFESKDFYDMVCKGRYQFELSGDAKFASTNSKTYVIDYTGGVIKIPIVITGIEQVSCKAYYLKASD